MWRCRQQNIKGKGVKVLHKGEHVPFNNVYKKI